MNRKKTIKTFALLGDTMRKWGQGAEKKEFHLFIGEEFYERMQDALVLAKAHNGWFTPVSVEHSLRSLGDLLTIEKLTEWTNKYPLVKNPKQVGLILAGNIPLVGFHDVLTTIFSGNKAQVKMSNEDKVLFPLLFNILFELQPELAEQIEIVERLNDAEAVIATGSDNTSRYFEKYFGHLPHIIRKNRTSVAVLTGNESERELYQLGSDIFSYFGLGCRNVSHLLLPKGYDLNNIFGAIVDYGEIIHHHKYGNNYDYYKAIYLMNEEKIIENGFVLLRETEELFAPIAVLHYHFYSTEEERDIYLQQNEEKIQVIVGTNYLPFGTSQTPQLEDYADGVNTMAFLTSF